MVKLYLQIYYLLLIFFVVTFFSVTGYTQKFISVKGTKFYLNSNPYAFSGTNFWYGMNLGSNGNSGDRERLKRELDILFSIGVTNLRIMAASEGPNSEPWRVTPALQTSPGVYNDTLLQGLDFLLSEMGKRNMKAVLCLNNMWPWTGGFAQYMNWIEHKEIPYPPPAKKGSWPSYIWFSSRFFNSDSAQVLYRDHISKIVNRTNSITDKAYKNDPTIMSWQLANEPRAVLNKNSYYLWVSKTAKFIKELDSNHLVSVGSEGNAVFPNSSKFKKEHSSPYIDYCTAHIWVQNWNWYNPSDLSVKSFDKALKKAKKYLNKHVRQSKGLQKPFVLDEFGLARDNGSYSDTASTKKRDLYFKEILALLNEHVKKGEASGFNFWAWAGEARAREEKAIWKIGDDFTGDPPFEYQGWYSVYNSDLTTIFLLKEMSREINSLPAGE